MCWVIECYLDNFGVFVCQCVFGNFLDQICDVGCFVEYYNDVFMFVVQVCKCFGVVFRSGNSIGVLVFVVVWIVVVYCGGGVGELFFCDSQV